MTLGARVGTRWLGGHAFSSRPPPWCEHSSPAHTSLKFALFICGMRIKSLGSLQSCVRVLSETKCRAGQAPLRCCNKHPQKARGAPTTRLAFSAGVCVHRRSAGASAHSNSSETETDGSSSQKMFPPFQRLSKENTISPTLFLQSLAVKGLAAHLLADCYMKKLRGRA